ncbi:MAG: YigZ family protein [Bacteroidetes bacterium]|nr:YigZ family protein [Bacteroidota bacterium]
MVEYLSIEEPGRGEWKEKGSRFLSFAYPVENEDEIKSRLHELKLNFPNATHHCYAWVLGTDGNHYRANDDGEPNHSAGTPILRQIHSFQLSQILVVVVRFFGGTKLGVPGLIHAYGHATKLALEASNIIRKKLQSSATLRYTFQEEGLTYRIVKILDAQIIDTSYNPEPSMKIRFDLDKFGLLESINEQFPTIDITCNRDI